MEISRRHFLAGTALAAVPAVARAAAPAGPALKDELAAVARAHRLRVHFDGRAFSGPGWDRLVEAGSAARFFLLGEEHGVAQIPALARELVLALRPAGYTRLVLEISAPVATELDRAALGGVGAIRRFIAEFPPGPAFYNMKEEAEFLAAVRPAFRASETTLWGLDYEVIQDRRLIARLREKAPAAARAAVRSIDEASAAAWKKYEATHDPRDFFTFSGDPKLAAAVRAAWPEPDARTDVILEVLQGTLEANAFWVRGQGWESNERRTALMRRAFVRYWNAEKAHGRTPRVFFKFGASHMVRGRDMSEVYDLGNLAAEAAALEGGTSFHLLVAPPRTAKHGRFDPTTLRLVPTPATSLDDAGVGFLADVAYPDGFTLIDLRPLRPVLGYRTRDFDARATRVVHGFDAMLVLAGATPAVLL